MVSLGIRAFYYFRMVNKKATYQSAMLFLALVILIGSSGVSFSFHFCGSHLASMKIWGEAPNCHEMVTKSCCSGKSSKHSCKVTTLKECSKKCCTDKELTFDEAWEFPNHTCTTKLESDIDFFCVKPPVVQIPILQFVELERRIEPPPNKVLEKLSFLQVWRL